MTLTISDFLTSAADPMMVSFDQHLQVKDFLNLRRVSRFFQEFFSQDNIWNPQVNRQFSLPREIKRVDSYLKLYSQLSNNFSARINRDTEKLKVQTQKIMNRFDDLVSDDTPELRVDFAAVYNQGISAFLHQWDLTSKPQRINFVFRIAIVANMVGLLAYHIWNQNDIVKGNINLVEAYSKVMSVTFTLLFLTAITGPRDSLYSYASKPISFVVTTLPGIVMRPVNAICRMCESVHYYVNRR